jgi:hypothetical protein
MAMGGPLYLSYPRVSTKKSQFNHPPGPARQRDREESLERTLSRAMGDRERIPGRQPERSQEHTHVRTPMRQQSQALSHLRALMAGLAQDAPVAGAALRVCLWEREHERDGHNRGMGW